MGVTRARAATAAIVAVAGVLLTAGIGGAEVGAPESGKDPATDSVPIPDTAERTTVTGTVTHLHVHARPELGGEAPGDAVLLSTEHHGMVLLGLPSQLLVESGSTVTVTGMLDRVTSTMSLIQFHSVQPPKEAPPGPVDGTDDKGDQRVPAEPTDDEDARAAGPASAADLSVLVIPYNCGAVLPPGAPSTTDLRNLVDNDVNPWYRSASLGARGFRATVTNWVDICASPTITDPLQGALMQGYLHLTFDRVVMYNPNPGWWFIGAAENIPGRQALIFETTDPAVWNHELGHLEGLTHANRLSCTQGMTPAQYSLTATCVSYEYEDPANVMGGIVGGSIPSPGINAGFSTSDLEKMGWINPSELPIISAGNTQTLIVPMSSNLNAPRGVRIPLASGEYFVEFRQPTGIDAGLAAYPALTNGVQLRVKNIKAPAGAGLGSSSSGAFNTFLLDGVPATTGVLDALPWGQTFLTPEGVKIKALQSGSFAKVYVSYPTGPQAPSAPTNVTASVDSTTGVITASWDPPIQTGSGPVPLIYEVTTPQTSGAIAPVYTTGLSATLGPASNGADIVEVRAARIFGSGVSQKSASDLFFPAILPIFNPADWVIAEGSSGWHQVSLPMTLPWVPTLPPWMTEFHIRMATVPGTLSKSAGYALPPSTSTDDIHVDLNSPDYDFLKFNAGASVGHSTFWVNGDSTPEPNETAAVVVTRNLCLLAFPGCEIQTTVGNLIVVNDD